MQNKLSLFCLMALVGFVGMPNAALAVVVTITDNTPATASNDGTVNSGEYVGFSSGINSGFGDVIGAGSSLHVDSSIGGALNFGLVGGGADLNDIAVIYIDSVAGGLSDTTTIEDTGDPGRAAISGDGRITSDQSEITFAAGFGADYAISLSSAFSGLFRVEGSGALTFVTSTNLTPAGGAAATAGAWEIDLTLAQIGISNGDSFDYIATYLNADNAFRSDEFHGVDSFGGNPGANPVSLAAGDFNTFVSVPEPSAFLFGGLVCSVLGVKLARKRRVA